MGRLLPPTFSPYFPEDAFVIYILWPKDLLVHVKKTCLAKSDQALKEAVSNYWSTLLT